MAHNCMCHIFFISLHRIKNKKKMKKSKVKIYEKILKHDEDFDYSYLLKLERFKIKQMISSFENSNFKYDGITYDIRDMKMCVKLIDIILEEDKFSKKFLEQFESVKYEIDDNNRLILTNNDDIKIPIHINKNNIKRYINLENKENFNDNFLMELRKCKALKLYNKIRNKMFSWWW